MNFNEFLDFYKAFRWGFWGPGGVLGGPRKSWEVLGSHRKSWEVIGSHGEVLGAAIQVSEFLGFHEVPRFLLRISTRISQRNWGPWEVLGGPRRS